MPTYVYKAVTKNGMLVKNRVEEPSRQVLIKKLKENGLIPVDIIQTAFRSTNLRQTKKKKRNVSDTDEVMQYANTSRIGNEPAKTFTARERITLFLTKQDRITQKDIAVFTQNFLLLKKANFNNIHALNTIIQSTENLSFRGILEDIVAGVQGGENMYTTMEYYSNIFPPVYVNMIKVGEQSGSLTNSLEQALKYLDDTAAIRKKLRAILIPNIAQFVLLIVLLLVGTLYAIPAMQNVIQELGSSAQLPWITLWFQDFLNGVLANWYIPLAMVIAVVGGTLFYINTPKGKYNFHYFKYAMPVFGKLIYKLDFSRLMKAMHLNLQNGMRIQDALEVSKSVCKNYIMLSMVETAINNTLIGTSWVEPFEKASFSSPMQTEMLKIGMQTDLTQMMEKLVEYMDVEIDNELDRIMKVLPEIVYAIVGAVLIFFVLVVLVPCIQIYMGNWLFDAYL
ncbi:MAG: type II secretion system F family protein [Clostridia bacterium]|nr:type II secretion system F family protein [Clostridia bacterium]